MKLATNSESDWWLIFGILIGIAGFTSNVIIGPIATLGVILLYLFKRK